MVTPTTSEKTSLRAKSFELVRTKKCDALSLFLDEDAAYFDCRDGRIFAAPIGGTLTQLTVKVGGQISGITADATRLFFKSKSSEVSAVSKQGGAPSPFVTGLFVVGMRTDATYLYVSAHNNGVYRVPLTGGAPQLVRVGISPRIFAVAGNDVFYIDSVSGVRHLYVLHPSGSPPVDLGKATSLEHLLIAGGRLFANAEYEVGSLKKRGLPARDCTSFAADEPFVFASCDGDIFSPRGIFGRNTGVEAKWQPINDERASDALAVNSRLICWSVHDPSGTIIRCVDRPDSLRP